MKTLLRVAAILAATLFVVGGAFAVVQSTGSSLAASGPERGMPSDAAAFTPPTGDAATATGDALETRRDGGREAGGVSGLINVAKNAAVMAGITLVVMLGGLGWRKARDLRRNASAPLGPPSRPAADTSA